MRRRTILAIVACIAGLLFTGGLLAGGLLAALRPSGAPDSQITIGGPFSLTGADGRPMTSAGFRGEWMLIYFGFNNCPDACPLALNNIANALRTLKGRAADEVPPIFITVDPARDTPAVVGHYVSLFSRWLTGLTGTQAQIDQVEHEYRGYAAREPLKGGGYTMTHSSIIYVMDNNGRFSGVLDGNAGPDQIAAKISKLES